MSSIVGFESLHSHSHYSLLDGLATPLELAERACEINQQYVCITDHGMMGAIPSQIRACEKFKRRPLFGVEFYINSLHPGKDELERMSAADKRSLVDANGFSLRKSYHLLAIAHNNLGYRNMVRLCSWAHINGFYYRPRITWEQLRQHKEGLIVTSCCYNGEIGQAFDRRGPDAALEVIGRYHDLFGDHFYLEIMLLDFTKQKPYDAFLIKAHNLLGIPLVLTLDSHFARPEDSKFQRYMLMVQTETTIKELEQKLAAADQQDLFELQDPNLWLKSEEEINAKWEQDYTHIVPYELFCQAKQNSVTIARKAQGVEIDRSMKLPQIPDAETKLKEAVLDGLAKRGVRHLKRYQRRAEEEIELINRKGYASYFLIQKQFTDKAREIAPKILGWGDGDMAVGPGRGCLATGTKVVLTNGTTKPIERMEVGDQVYNRHGKPQPVLQVSHRQIDEPMLRVTTYYGNQAGCALTTDHRVLAEKSTQKNRHQFVEPTGKLDWLRAEQLEVGDWLWVPQLEFSVRSPSTAGINKRGRQKRFVFRDVDGGILTRIRSIQQLRRSVRWVHDIAVPDEAFLTDSFVVHNSAVSSLVFYALGVTDVDPIRHDLLFSRFLSESRGGKSMRLRFSGPPMEVADAA